MTEKAWLIKDVLWTRTLIFLWNQAGHPEQAVPSIPQDCGICASPLETGLELLFQGGFLQVSPDLYSPQEGLPLLVPSVPQDCGIRTSPLEAGVELLFQDGYPWCHLICTLLGGAPPPGFHLPSLAFMPPKFHPQPVCHF